MAGSNRDAVSWLLKDSYTWSYLWWCRHAACRSTIAHVLALVVFALLTIGLFSRTMSVLAFVATASYVGRAPGALFGLDQINLLLSMYLMVGPSGAAYSLDRWLTGSPPGRGNCPRPQPSIAANIAIRLIQLHLCVIYLYAGMGKLMGPAWWNGTAMWQGDRQPGIPIDRPDLAGRLAATVEPADPRDDLLGAVLLRADLAPRHAADHAGPGRAPCTWASPFAWE